MFVRLDFGGFVGFVVGVLKLEKDERWKVAVELLRVV